MAIFNGAHDMTTSGATIESSSYTFFDNVNIPNPYRYFQLGKPGLDGPLPPDTPLNHPLVPYLLVPSGSTVALTVDAVVTSDKLRFYSPSIGPGANSEDVTPPKGEEPITVQYSITIPDHKDKLVTPPLVCFGAS